MAGLMTYNWFARIYDDLMDESLYSKWLRYTEEHISENSSILELGCGTGVLGVKLKRQGYDITGLDLSEDMLSLAYNRQKEENVSFPLLQRDMRDLADLPKYEGIVCYSDALCYMENKKELTQIFQEVYNNLETDGKFLFDVHSTYQIETFLTTSFHDVSDSIVFLWDSFRGEKPFSVEHQLTFFVPNDNNLYKRYEEVHKERTYPLEDYIKLLEEVGFKEIEVSADFDKEVQEHSKRWFFACSK